MSANVEWEDLSTCRGGQTGQGEKASSLWTTPKTVWEKIRGWAAQLVTRKNLSSAGALQLTEPSRINVIPARRSEGGIQVID